MVNKDIRRGIYPTMVTPFTVSGSIDYKALRGMMEFFLKSAVQGVFAVCQSSEMFFLSLSERVELAKAVVELNGELSAKLSREPLSVVASGHVSDTVKAQAEEAWRIYETGIDAFVLVSNRLDPQQMGDEEFKSRALELLQETGDMPLGIYECPYPYKRLLSPALARWCADTGRFLFLKDTSCDLGQLKDKIDALKGTAMKLFNANAQTLPAQLTDGGGGVSLG